MRENLPPITVIIPNYNGRHLLKQNLPAVIAATQNYSGIARILVVDDASQDDSKLMLEANFSSVDVVGHEQNLGFAEAVSTGIRECDTEFLILLNSDVIPDKSFIAPLISHLQKPDVFSVSPLIIDEHNSVSKYSWNRRYIKRGKFVSTPWTLEEAINRAQTGELESLYASGGSMACKKSMFERLGGFDPIFKPFYKEDLDLGIRAWLNGWRTLFEPRSVVVHEEGQGSILENIRRDRVRCARQRNSLLLEWIHLSKSFLFFQFFPRYLRQLSLRIFSGDIIFYKGFAGAVRKLPEVLLARKKRGCEAQISFEDLLNSLGRNEG